MLQRPLVWLLTLAVVLLIAFVARNGGRWWLEWQIQRELSAWLEAHSQPDERVLGRWPLAKRPHIPLPESDQGLQAPQWLSRLQSELPELVLTDHSINWQLITNTSWFQSRYVIAYERPPYALWRFQPRPDDVATPKQLDVSINEQYRLVSAQLAPKSIQPDQSLYITLDFEAVEPLPRTGQTILQVISPLGGQPYANVDVQLPAESPLGWWEVGTTLSERYVLTPTADIPMGAYQLNFAARSSAVPERWPLFQGGDDNALDKVTLAYVAVPWAGTMGEQVITLNAQLGDVITLHGYELRGSPQRGEMIEVELFWEGNQPTADYRVYVHLLNEAGEYVTGHDGPPQGGNYSTLGWFEGDIVPDVHPLTIPADLPAGMYQLKTGLYLPENNLRLVVTQDGNQPADQSVFLQQIVIE